LQLLHLFFPFLFSAISDLLKYHLPLERLFSTGQIFADNYRVPNAQNVKKRKQVILTLPLTW